MRVRPLLPLIVLAACGRAGLEDPPSSLLPPPGRGLEVTTVDGVEIAAVCRGLAGASGSVLTFASPPDDLPPGTLIAVMQVQNDFATPGDTTPISAAGNV